MLLIASKNPVVTATVQKEIEALLKQGLKDETDYSLLEGLYGIAKLPEQAKLITTIEKEKFPNGKWVINETIQKFNAEADPVKKEQLLAEITQKIETDENWKAYKSSLSYYQTMVTSIYARKKDWEGFKNAIAKAKIKNQDELAMLYNNTAWEMQKTSDNLPYAEEMSRMAVTQAKNEWMKPTGEKPSYLSKKQWDKSREATYGMYADTYGMIMYRKGEYKKGLPYAKDAAIKIEKGQSADENNTYALLAEKALPLKQYKKELEQFVKDG